MHIHKLMLKRFRGAHSLSLELHEQVNIFFGINGVGKTTILDAASILLSWLVNRIKSSNASGRPITKLDIRNGESSANLEITLCERDKNFTWNLAKVREGYSRSRIVSVLNPVSELAKQIQEEISKTGGKVNLPLFVYYPVNRAVIDIPLRIREKHRFDLLTAYDDSLTGGGADFRTFFEWFREREDLENENRIKNDSFSDFQLEAVRNALHQFMPEFNNLTVRRSPLRMEVEKNGVKLTVNQLSDGEKCLMALIGDLARRLAIANPERIDPLDGEGVILIDEIDLHLHPKWQRLIIPGLTKTFPHCQFMISTHSPHILTQVRSKNLFLLTLNENVLTVKPSTESYGKTVERILEDLMGLDTTRPDDVKQAISNIYNQIDKGELTAARDSIRDLQSSIGEDSDLVKAGVLIKRKELIGK